MDDRYVVRRDIFSVKVFDRDGQFWCHTRMFTDRQAAKTWIKGEKACDPSVMTKIVHPKHWVVDQFLALGNTID